MTSDPFSAVYGVYTGVVFGFLAPRYMLIRYLREDRYAAAAYAAMGMYVANVAISILGFQHEWKLALAMAFSGPLLALWISLLVCGLDRGKAGYRSG